MCDRKIAEPAGASPSSGWVKPWEAASHISLHEPQNYYVLRGSSVRTPLRKIGNSKGVIIPAALLNECGLSETVELRLDDSRLVIEPVKHRRADWFQGYDVAQDDDAWADLPKDADAVDWEW